MTSATRFTHAIVRRPADSAVNGLRAVDRGAPDVDALRREHAAYVDTLTRLGLTVDVLDPLEAHPDSVFVEDPALVFPEAAILLRPGAPSRLGETAALEPVLRSRFAQVRALGEAGERGEGSGGDAEGEIGGCHGSADIGTGERPEPSRDSDVGFADGGDVLLTCGAVYIGLSARTDLAGATRLARILASLGRRAVIVTPPPGVLHLKTGCSLLDDETVLATRAVADASLFPGLATVVVPEGEEAVANALCVNGTVLIAAGFPRTADLLAGRGYDVRDLRLDEVMKLDSGLSCMSLRW
ncbi:dimethylarginine dimethylaminohydrolase family protein [Luteitalea sp.]